MVSPEQERVWSEWERRNPGVAHPDRIKERNKRGHALKAKDYAQATDTFARKPPTLSEQAQRARGTWIDKEAVDPEAWRRWG